MVNKVRNEVAVGLTVTAALVLAIYIIIILADFSSITTAQHDIIVKVPYREGLRGIAVGSPVILGGVKVGQVVDAKIIGDNKDLVNDANINVQFTMRMPACYQLHEDCVLTPQANMLGGNAVLNIEKLGTKGEPIAPGEAVEIHLSETLFDAVKREFDPENKDGILARVKKEVNEDIEGSLLFSLKATAKNLADISVKIKAQVSDDDERKSLISKINRIMDNFNVITESLKTQLDVENEQAVITNIHTALDKLNGSLSEIKKLVTNTRPDIQAAAASIKNTVGQLEKDLPAIIEKIKVAIDNVDASFVKIKEFVTSAQDLLTSNRQQIDQIIANATEVSVNLKLVSREVRRAPWRLLYKPEPKEIKIQSVVDSAAAFAAGAERLDSAVTSLQKLITGGKVGPEDEGKVKNMISELKAGFKNYKIAEDKFWDDLKE